MYIYAPKKYWDPPYHRVVHTNPPLQEASEDDDLDDSLLVRDPQGILVIHHGEAKIFRVGR